MKKRILLVAMESDLVESVPIKLRLAGHRVVTADCGLEAIKKARRLLPDLILVDAMLPDMEGATVVDILRRLPSTGELRTVLLTPRQPAHLRGGAGEPAPQPLSDLAAQLAPILALWQESITAELEVGHSGMRAV